MIATLTATETLLDRLLAPLTAETFLARNWARRPLRIRVGLDRLETLLGKDVTAETYQSGLARLENRSPGRTFANGNRSVSPSPDSERTHGIPVRAGQLSDVANAGFAVTGPFHDTGAHRVAGLIKQELNFAGDVAVIASLLPAGERMNTHFEPMDRFHIQIEGTQRVRVGAAPVVEWPRQVCRVGTDGAVLPRGGVDPLPFETEPVADLSHLEEILLEPGDVLYIPNGVVRAWESPERSFCLYIDLIPANPLPLYFSMAERALQPDEAWRRLPLQGEGAAMPEEVRAYFAARIHELADFFDRIADDEFETSCAFQEMVAAMGDATDAVTWRTWWKPDTREIEPESRLELSTYAPLTHAAGQNASGEFEVRAFQGDAKVAVAGSGGQLLLEILRRKEFIASDAMTWHGGEPYPWEVTRQFLESLRDSGLLRQ